jgi:hypothetical protein
MTIPITSAIDLSRSDHCEQSYLYPEYDMKLHFTHKL